MASPAPFNAVRGIAPSNQLRFAARSRGIELPRRLSCCPSFSSDSAILDNVRSYGRSALILCSAGVVF